MQIKLQAADVSLYEVQRALRRTGYTPLHRLKVNMTEDCVRMEGQVPTWFLKQLAQEVVIKVEGVIRIDNALKVGVIK